MSFSTRALGACLLALAASTAHAAPGDAVALSKSANSQAPNPKADAVRANMAATGKGVRRNMGATGFTVSVEGIANGERIPEQFAYCIPNTRGGTLSGLNISPGISWSNIPAGTRSLALIMVDKDVPASFDKANAPGEVIEQNAPRQNFYHWVIADIPPTVTGILEGKDSRGITQGGKPFGRTDYGTTGQNDYVKMDASGPNGGYDGPCPPWNDQRMHNYHFIVYALDIASVRIPNPINARQLEVAMRDHILAQAEVVGTFTNNPGLLGRRQ